LQLATKNIKLLKNLNLLILYYTICDKKSSKYKESLLNIKRVLSTQICKQNPLKQLYFLHVIKFLKSLFYQ